MPKKDTSHVHQVSGVNRPSTAAQGNEEGDRQRIKSADAAKGRSDEPALYTIDLALPPTERYVHVARDSKDKIQSLTGLFGELVHDIHPRLPVAPFTILGKLFLRKLFSAEETEEIRGISKATGVDMYLLVAFNLLLDTMMGCSSGGVRVGAADGRGGTRMLHYRTLDWGMDPLREAVVRLQYKNGTPEIIARTVTYVGYVGVLTGVKPGLSLSLNFRAEHDCSLRKANFEYYWHLAKVMLGWAPSISSILRSCLLPVATGTPSLSDRSSCIEDAVDHLKQARSCAAFLIVSNGEETFVLEKDLNSAKVLRSRAFVAATNSDQRHDPADWSEFIERNNDLRIDGPLGRGQALAFLLEDAVDRKQCMTEKWEEACDRYKIQHRGATDDDVRVSKDDVLTWVNDFPITNETTHFACIMDPKAGDIIWSTRRRQPAVAPKHLRAKDD